jgi:hypothetical protein
MPRLNLKFAVHLVPADFYSSLIDPKGPSFHRWLPDGEADAILLRSAPGSRLMVWFERRGHVDQFFVVYDQARKEVDPAIMKRQCKLDAGPLFGAVEISDVREEELEALRDDKKGDASYVSLGKRVVNKIIVPPVARFIKTLRTHYGQYWLLDLNAWDSRDISLGAYCASALSLRWRSDDGATWKDFRPTESVYQATAYTGGNYQDYLTREDWEALQKYSTEEFESSLAAATLATTHEYLDRKNFRSALIEGVLALELAMNDLVHKRLAGSQLLLKSIPAFIELPLRSQLVAFAHQVPNTLSVSHLEAATRAIENRNKVIHEGWSPDPSVRQDILALMKAVSLLIEGPRFKFPELHSGNQLLGPDDP